MGLRALTVESLLEFEQLGITYHRRPYELAPEWLLVHGDEGGMSQEPGRTALRLANKFGKSVVCGHCFDDQTQILTPEGWVSHDALSEDSVVLTMNKDTGAGEWQKVEGVHRYTHYRELVNVKAMGVDLAVTPDHGLITVDPRGFRYPKASEVEGKEVAIPLALRHDEESLPLSDDEIRVLAWIMAEGDISPRGYVRIAQSDTPKGGLAALEATLDGAGLRYSKHLRYRGGEDGHGVHHNYDAYRYSILGGKCELADTYLDGASKNPLRRLAGMSSAQAEVFLREYAKADGQCDRHDTVSIQLNTAEVEKLDFFQELAVRSGFRSSTSGGGGRHYTLTLNERGAVHVHAKSWSRSAYDGVVWCVTVPNGTLVVRRGGRTAITQNTHRLGLISNVQAVNGKTTRALWGFEVGNIMDMRKAGYLGGGSANWHMGAGILYVDGRHVTPVLVPLRADGSFTVGGREYRG
jgi:hypothetical protein